MQKPFIHLFLEVLNEKSLFSAHTGDIIPQPKEFIVGWNKYTNSLSEDQVIDTVVENDKTAMEEYYI